MTPERWRQVEELFNAALELPLADRDSWITSACGEDRDLEQEVRSLIARDGMESTLAFHQPVKQAVVDLHRAQAPGRMAGPYELLERIGQGGMGTVYRARRADEAYQTIVAIKLVRTGMDTEFILSRFKRERQTLAKLTHPNIARLLDGGTTADGTPYIVMEFIEGVWITGYCQAKKLPTRERLELFRQICSAVDYAHRNFVIHRDIKPGNILVDKTGTPKLLDFGICKLIHANPLEQETAMSAGLGMMTPDYASPEQVLGEAISPRSDVYSLGAVLYEILTGKKAHRVEKYTPLGLEEAICRADTVLPSLAAESPAVARDLQGDLDNIVLRAMRKDPERRYESAAALALDLGRFLEDLPVEARPDTGLYRARKFVKRHRGMVAAVTTIILALGIGFGVAVRQARRAESREQQLRTLARSLLFEVHDSVQNLPGATKARQTIVETGTRYMDALAGTNPTEPDLLLELAGGYSRLAAVQGNSNRGSNLGNPTAALANYRKALRYGESYLAARPHDFAARLQQAELLRHTADVEVVIEGPKKAVDTYRRSLAMVRALPEADRNPRVRELAADILMAMGRQEREQGEWSLSLEHTGEALAVTEALARTDPSPGKLGAVASAASAVGMAQARLDRLEPALAHYRRAVEIGEQLVARQPSSVSARRNLMIAYSHVGDVAGYPTLPNLGNTPMAQEAFAKSVAQARSLRGADETDARARLDLLIALTRYAVASPATDPAKLAALREAIGLLPEALRRAPSDLNVRAYAVVTHTQLGMLLRERGDPGAALAEFDAAIEAGTPALARGNENFQASFLTALNEQAVTLAQRGRVTAALEVAARTITSADALATRVRDKTVVGVLTVKPRAYGVMARVQAAAGHAAEASAWREKALAGWRELESKTAFLPHHREEKLAMEKFQSPRTSERTRR